MGAVAGGALGVMGVVGGSQKEKVTQTQSSGNVSEVQAAPATAEETEARQISFDSLKALKDRLATLDKPEILANLDKLIMEMGQAPTASRIAESQSTAQALFAPREVGLQQSQELAQQQFAARAAQLGRSSADPILAAKLAQEQIRQRAAFEAERGAFATDMAMNRPSQLFQNQVAGLGGLSQAAIQNRQAVFSMGSAFANQEMNYRLATAKRLGTTNTFGDTQSGGGLRGAMLGGIAGASAGLQAMRTT